MSDVDHMVDLVEELDSLEEDSETQIGPSTSSQGSASSSLLAQLRSPTPSDLARPRKIKHNKLPVGKKHGHSAGSRSYNPKSLSPHQRVCEFPNESLCVSAGKLFCNTCREEIALKTTVM